jgi:hypothetical protein
MHLPASLHFHGPFTFVDHGRGIARSEFAASEGLYLWVMRDGERRFVHYVGETTAFLKRHKEHLTQILGGNYGIFRADAVAANDPAPIYGGMWRMHAEDPLSTAVAHWRTIHGAVLAYLDSIEVFFAPTALPGEVRKHVEGRIARQLTERHPAAARFYPPDNWTRTLPEPFGARIAVVSARRIEGLDPSIEA